MQNFINLGKDEKQQADLFRETEASTMYPLEKNSMFSFNKKRTWIRVRFFKFFSYMSKEIFHWGGGKPKI